MPAYITSLASRDVIAEGTMAFRWRRSAGFSFVPGQNLDLVVPGESPVDGDQNLRHTFSIVSAPHEDQLEVATRMRDSAFKRAVRSMPLDTSVSIEGPFGSLGLHDDSTRAAVFIAGGIGITPFISMLRHATKVRSPQRLVLIYSNRRPEHAAYLAELKRAEIENRNFRLVATMTEMSEADHARTHQTGLIDEKLVSHAVAELISPVYYVVGPPAMVESMRGLLVRIGVASDDIRSEEFYGY